ncbi:hypothetical protein [Parapedobacter koreensis]|uniref:hypothetical protein n=1 Tax=Parapedobacter koreensis TaxID=332977 RepID=UPI0015A6CDDE|nr:hypothetical protein [Parapedobacter koreensis]
MKLTFLILFSCGVSSHVTRFCRVSTTGSRDFAAYQVPGIRHAFVCHPLSLDVHVINV